MRLGFLPLCRSSVCLSSVPKLDGTACPAFCMAPDGMDMKPRWDTWKSHQHSRNSTVSQRSDVRRLDCTALFGVLLPLHHPDKALPLCSVMDLAVPYRATEAMAAGVDAADLTAVVKGSLCVGFWDIGRTLPFSTPGTKTTQGQPWVASHIWVIASSPRRDQ